MSILVALPGLAVSGTRAAVRYDVHFVVLPINDAPSFRPSELAIWNKQEQGRSCLREGRCLDSLSAITHFSDFEYVLRPQIYFKFHKLINSIWMPDSACGAMRTEMLGISHRRWGYYAALSSPLTYRIAPSETQPFRLLSYMYSSSRHSVSQTMQRSQSTPNVGVRPTEQRPQLPRRTKTSIDFLAAPPQNSIHREKRVDPFNLAGFFPSGLRQSDQEPSGWWRDEDPEGSEELASELTMLGGDNSSLGSQRVLFTGEDQPAEEVIKREDKLGVLTICAHLYFIPSK
jgi:hypothetical protein